MHVIKFKKLLVSSQRALASSCVLEDFDIDIDINSESFYENAVVRAFRSRFMDIVVKHPEIVEIIEEVKEGKSSELNKKENELLEFEQERIRHFPKFEFYNSGKPSNPNLECLHLREIVNKIFDDNYLCESGPYDFSGWRWSSAGPIENMKCIQWSEDTPSWGDNYICMPLTQQYEYKFVWSHSHEGLEGLNCTQIYESVQYWEDNYFCVSLEMDRTFNPLHYWIRE